jgi:selenoprotein W-related protein
MTETLPAQAEAAATPLVKVTITYCAECGYEPQTLSLTDALMRTFTHQLAAIELVPWYEGSFDVAVGGKLVHSMYRDGGFPENEKIIQAVREQLAS